MCFNQQPAQDNSAQVARDEATAREARVNEGKGKIDSAFNVFDPAYFSKFNQSYLDAYNPQVDEQFGDARKTLKYDLARKGVTNSTPGQTRFGKLADAYTDRRREIAGNADTAANDLRSKIDAQKGALYDQNVAAADPSLSAVRAASAAGALQTPASYSPLADLFSGVVNAGSQYVAGQNRALPSGYGAMFAPGATVAGSGRVVR